MGSPEQFRPPDNGQPPRREILSPNHFYAAYVFDQAENRQHDVGAVITEATRLNCLMRYWWLSEAMPSEDIPDDRLIVCVHHPASDENAGMDLYEALKKKKIAWDDLEAANVGEYRRFGQPITSPASIRARSGNFLFPTLADQTPGKI